MLNKLTKRAPDSATPSGGGRHGSRIANAVASWLLSHPAMVVIALLLMVAASAVGGARLPQEVGLERFLEPDSPARVELDGTREQFGNEARIFVIYRSADIFSAKSLGELEQLTQTIAELEGPDGPGSYLFDDVTSLSTVDTLEGSEMSFRAEPLMPEDQPVHDDTAAEVARRAMGNPIIAEELLADGNVATVIGAELPPDADDAYDNHATHKLREAVAALTAKPDFEGELLVTGRPVVEADVAGYQLNDVNRFVPIIYLLVTVILLVLVRRVLAVVVALISVTLSIVAAMALLTAVGSSLNSLSTMLIPVMMTLSVALVVHYLTELSQCVRDGDPRSAVKRATAKLLGPVLLAAITTAVGFGSLSLSPIPALHEFGITAGLATMASLVVTTLVVVLAFRLLPHRRLAAPGRGASSPAMDRALAGLSAWVRRRASLILAASCLAVAVLVMGILRIEADMNDIESFPADAPVREASLVMDRDLGGSVSLVFMVEHPDEAHFVNPEPMGRIDQFRAELLEHPRIERVTSYVEYLKLMHREFFNGDPKEYRIPDKAEAAAQLLVLNSDTRVEDYLDPEQRRVRVLARSVEHDTMKLAQMFSHYQAELQRLFPASEGYKVVATGASRVHADATKTLINSQIKSLAVGGGIIMLMVLLLFGSLRIGLLALPGNLIPVVAALGLLGWLGIRLNAATVMIAVVALGIAVDDTIHFLKRYVELRDSGEDTDGAIDGALRNKGPAIVGTSLAVGAGMFVTFASNFGPVRNFGWLTAVAMLAAMLGDLIVLPALITVCSRLKTMGKAQQLPKEAFSHARS